MYAAVFDLDEVASSVRLCSVHDPIRVARPVPAINYSNMTRQLELGPPSNYLLLHTPLGNVTARPGLYCSTEFSV